MIRASTNRMSVNSRGHHARVSSDTVASPRPAVVQAAAEQMGIALLFLPSYSPNLNLITRLWKFIKNEDVSLMAA